MVMVLWAVCDRAMKELSITPKTEASSQRTCVWSVLILITIFIHGCILFGPEHVSWLMSLSPLLRTLIVLSIPTVWSFFLLVRYRTPPEKYAAFFAFTASAFWWLCWVVGSVIRP